MKFVQYGKQNNGELLRIGEEKNKHAVWNHVYEGDLTHIHQIETGLTLLLIKNEDIEQFKNGKNELFITSIRMKENYTGFGNVSLAHTIQREDKGYANGAFIDEINMILEEYAEKGYSLISPSDYGQFFAYTNFEKEVDFTEKRTQYENHVLINLSFTNAECKESFSWLLEDTFFVEHVLAEIGALKRSKDVYFVHLENAVGYACGDFEKLKKLAGNLFKNYLIES